MKDEFLVSDGPVHIAYSFDAYKDMQAWGVMIVFHHDGCTYGCAYKIEGSRYEDDGGLAARLFLEGDYKQRAFDAFLKRVDLPVKGH